MDERAIGVYDSGIGGTTVFKDLEKLLPNENYIYFGDTKNLPYGTKTKNELLEISDSIFGYFAEKNVKAVVMACNTTSSTVYEEMHRKYDFEIYPIIQIATKCIAPRYTGKIGVLATIATIASNKYKTELLKHNKNLEVIQQACPDWVKVVESKDYDSPQSINILKSALTPILEKGCKNIILGCTHYPYLTETLKRIAGEEDINFINPAKDFTDFIAKDLEAKQLMSAKKLYEPQFCVSANPENFVKAAKAFYKLKDLPKVVNL